MRVRYVGASSTGVKVVHPDPAMPDANTVTVCPLGETVELPDDVALEHLAAAGGFEPGDAAAKRALARHLAEQPPADDSAEAGLRADSGGDTSTEEP